MPEIKHQFTGGKMNKDVDERLVPNGEYRDAMNIQVSTSEGGDVGTIQNILGNKIIEGQGMVSATSTCVGSVADEKNDALYWFLTDGEHYNIGSFTSSSPQPSFKKSTIIRYKNNLVEPIFVDIEAVFCTIYQSGGPITWDSIAQTITFPNFSFTQYLSVGMSLHIDSTLLMQSITGVRIITNISGTTITISGDLTWLDTNVSGQQSMHATRLIFSTNDRGGVLQFDTGKIITGINIIDGLLLWTDGYTEPKKINIKRCKEGTDVTGLYHTRLLVEGVDKGLVEKKHITVIKKGPSNPPNLIELISLREGKTSGVTEKVDFSNINGVLIQEGSYKWIRIDNLNGVAPNFQEGDILRLNERFLEQFPPEIFNVRVLVDSIVDGPHAQSGASATEKALGVIILSLSSETTVGPEVYEIALEEEGHNLFERKFPRFAYRYKYEDNEYSSIGPFSEVAFIPGHFSYHPTEAFNKGMVNNLLELTLQDFIPPDIPKDVVQVDLLYKNETAPNIYVIKSISKDDTVEDNGYNAWTSPGSQDGLYGSYKITTENIYAQLPSNQIIRAWDNVPRKALAQEVTGNRIVYANYTQGYNLTNISEELITPKLTAGLDIRVSEEGSGKIGQKSIKSLRTYNLGVVYGDEYGRETPVFTHPNAAQIVPKTQSTESNLLTISISNEHPSWAEYYKIFVKETSNEYYNLAMDRIYDAKDGNVWISFPSVDRNKVDEDTYIILKKGIDNQGAVIEEARYKIVAIENEAPDYIKTTYTLLAEPNLAINGYSLLGGTSTGSAAVFTTPEAQPAPGHSSFSIRKTLWSEPYDPFVSHMGLSDLVLLWEEKGLSSMYVSFSNNEVQNTGGQKKRHSNKYLITSIEEQPTAGSPVYVINLNKPIPDSDSWITDNIHENWEDGGQLRTHFFKQEIVSKPEFDGRFFVKIHDEQLLRDNLVSDIEIKDEYAVIATTELYHLRDADAPYGAGTWTTGDVHYHDSSKTVNDWDELLKFGGSNTVGKWFIDATAYAGIQPNSTNNIGNADPTINGVDASDITSDQRYCTDCSGGYETPGYGTGWSTGAVFKKGIHTDASSGDYAFHLSYSALDPSAGPYGYNWFPNWDLGNDNNSYTEHERDIVMNLKQHSKFRIMGNPNVYTIIEATKERVYNFRGAMTVPIDIHWPNQGQYSDYHSHSPPGTSNSQYLMNYREQVGLMTHADNRRISYLIKYKVDAVSGIALASLPNNDSVMDGNVHIITATSPGYIEFLEPHTGEEINTISRNPAIFETEPKEDIDIDIYYEASGKISTANTLFIPIGATVSFASEMEGVLAGAIPEGTFVTGWDGEMVEISNDILLIDITNSNNELKFTNDDGSYTIVTYNGGPVDVGTNSVNTMNILSTGKHGLAWFNCWSFNNGVESNRVGDTFNKPFITNGAKASTTLLETYEEEHRKYGLIYSGLYNSISGVNDLNQFIAGEKITKDVNPTYGSIQKLHSRDTDLITLCEDKILKILANKDAVYNADGNSQLTSTNNVLGQTIPFSGEFGISKNPESFASENYRVYFTDKVRGAVMRLSRDGLTPISDAGMKDWFRDNLKLNNTLIGSYDDKKDEYNITLNNTNDPALVGPVTVSFREDVRGWVSFKSFIPENAISCANEYYTFENGKLWKHHDETEDRNTFYNVFTPTSFNVILNDLPGSIKSFTTLNYEGSQSKVNKFTEYTTYDTFGINPTGVHNDDEFYNLEDKEGWYVENIETNKEKGKIPEFIEKEGKWFNYIKGLSVTTTENTGGVVENYDTSSFAIQGIGSIWKSTVGNIFGCMDKYAFNYNPNASIPDGSCIAKVFGCIDPTASNFDPLANTDDGSCTYPGCTDETAINYNPLANLDDGSCIATVLGCTNAAQTTSGTFTYYTYVNYDPNANVDDGSCTLAVIGCTDNWTVDGCGIGVNEACNYNASANTNDGSCTYANYGCMDPDAVGYDPNATFDDPADPCLFCGDTGTPPPDNYDGAVYPNGTEYLAGCLYCAPTQNLHHLFNNTTTTSVDLAWDDPAGANWVGGTYNLVVTEVTTGTVFWDAPPPYLYISGNLQYSIVTGLTPGTEYTFEVTLNCNTTSSASATETVTTLHFPGCTDNTGIGNSGGSWGACNYDPNATSDDGSCFYDACAGCTDAAYTEYCNDCWDATNLVAVTSGGSAYVADDGSCTTLITYGCTDPLAFNYGGPASPSFIEDGSCYPVINGCMNPLANNFIPLVNDINIDVNTDDGSCTYTCGTSAMSFNAYNGIDYEIDFTGTVYNTVSYLLSAPSNAYSLLGDNTQWGGATLYTATMNMYALPDLPGLHDGIHTLEVTFSDSNGVYPDCIVNSSIEVIKGCMDPNACNYNILNNIDDNTCQSQAGCTDPLAVNYDVNNVKDCNGDCGNTDVSCCCYAAGCATAPNIGNLTVPGTVTTISIWSNSYSQEFEFLLGTTSTCGDTYGYEIAYRQTSPSMSWPYVMPIPVSAGSSTVFSASNVIITNAGPYQNSYPLRQGFKYKFRYRTICGNTASAWSQETPSIQIP